MLRFGYIHYDTSNIRGAAMPFYHKDQVTAQPGDQNAEQPDFTRQDPVRLTAPAEPDLIANTMPLRERFARLRAEDLLPTRTGLSADKAFFDDPHDDARR